MRKLLGASILCFALSSLGSAQGGFAGASLSGLYLPTANQVGADLTIGFFGGHVGSYDLLGPVGLRGAFDFSVTPISGFLSGSGDILFASGGDTRFYGGAGLGAISLFGFAGPFAQGVAGVDFGLSESASLFAEATPRFFLQTGVVVLGGRFGTNFHFRR